MKEAVKVLDNGYLQVIESWGSDERIIEAARMSTGKGFTGWGPKICSMCHDRGVIDDMGLWRTYEDMKWAEKNCSCKGDTRGDEKLLDFLYSNKHTTPFEMAGLTIEVQAPIFVFREWHRHRTQSYNEMSARYTPLPDVNYVPTRERVIEGASNTANKQATGTNPLLREAIADWQMAVRAAYEALERTYQTGLELGIPKELARIVLPVGRYSRMRASANLLNWLKFLKLRMATNAQWEIRQYALHLFNEMNDIFPRTMQLFKEEISNGEI